MRCGFNHITDDSREHQRWRALKRSTCTVHLGALKAVVSSDLKPLKQAWVLAAGYIKCFKSPARDKGRGSQRTRKRGSVSVSLLLLLLLLNE